MTRRALFVLAGALACNGPAPLRVPGPTVARPTGSSVASRGGSSAVEVLARRNPSARVVAFRIVFDAGSSDDPSGKEGLTALAAEMTTQSGTQKLTFAELSRALYPMAASIDVHTGRDQTVLSADVAAADLDRFYPLLRDAVLRPRLDAESFSRLRARQKSRLDDELKGASDEALGKEALEAAIYGGHPYGHPAVGTDAGLAAMGLGDVRAQRERVFCKERARVGVAGAFPPGFDETVARDFAALPACAGPRPGLPEPARHHGLRVFIVDKPSADATAISLGFPTTMTRASEDFPAAYFFTSYVGLHRQSAGVLFHELRELRGLNYGDYAYPEFFAQDGWSRYPLPNIARREELVSLWLRPVKPANAVFALRGALHFWRAAIERGVPDAEIARFGAFLSRYASLEQQTESRRLGYALDDQHYRLASPYLARMRAAWSALDSRALAHVIARDFAGRDMTVAFVAKDGAALKKALVSGAASPPSYDTPKPKAVTDDDARIEALPLGLHDADVTVVPVADLFAR